MNKIMQNKIAKSNSTPIPCELILETGDTILLLTTN